MILPSVPREIIFVWKFVMKEYLKKKKGSKCIAELLNRIIGSYLKL